MRAEIIAGSLERTPFAGLDAAELRELARLLAKALTTSSDTEVSWPRARGGR